MGTSENLYPSDDLILAEGETDLAVNQAGVYGSDKYTDAAGNGSLHNITFDKG